MTPVNNLSGFEKLFQALSDRTRLRLLSLMAAGPVSVGYLADQLGESQPKTSRHLAYLRNAGLVSTSREGKWVYYGVDVQSDIGIQTVLDSTLRCISGNKSPARAVASDVIKDSEFTEQTHEDEWKPNEIDIYLL